MVPRYLTIRSDNQMDIQFIAVPAIDPMADGRELTIMVDNRVVIRVQGYGTDLYKWRVDPMGPDGSDPMDTMEELIGPSESVETGWFNAAQSFGKLATWWDERTFAHAIVDVLHNQ